MRVIDAHAHYAPWVMLKKLKHGESWFGAEVVVEDDGRETLRVRGRAGMSDARFQLTPEERVADMDRIGTDVQVLSPMPVLFNYDIDPDAGLAANQQLNDDILETVKAFPDRFRGLGSLPMQDVSLAVPELARCMEMGLTGVSLATNVNGAQWDEPQFAALFAEAERLGALLFFHANRGAVAPHLPRYHLENTIGHPVEDHMAAAALIMSGILERHPDLRVVIAHGGGNLCFGIARMDNGWKIKPKQQAIPKPPSAYLRSMYYDTITWGEAQLRFLIDQVGADRVVIGSDYPTAMGPESPRDWVGAMDSISDDERELIYHGNLERWLGL
jgi:aminocarboxymuconate-semialdehyde decarboxylase